MSCFSEFKCQSKRYSYSIEAEQIRDARSILLGRNPFYRDGLLRHLVNWWTFNFLPLTEHFADWMNEWGINVWDFTRNKLVRISWAHAKVHGFWVRIILILPSFCSSQSRWRTKCHRQWAKFLRCWLRWSLFDLPPVQGQRSLLGGLKAAASRLVESRGQACQAPNFWGTPSFPAHGKREFKA